MATQTVGSGRGGRIGRTAVRVVAAWAIALLVLGAAMGAADARNVVISQHDYVKLCKSTGGTPTTAGPHMVRCSYPGKLTSTCNFDTGLCTDVIPFTQPGNTGTHGEIGGGGGAGVQGAQIGTGAATSRAPAGVAAIDKEP